MKNNKENTNEKRKVGSVVREGIELIIYIAIIFIISKLIVTYVGQRVTVDGVSMYCTLDDGDQLVMDKLSYRLHDPKRFDIVIFPEGDGYYIKRIIALPGEKIQIDENGSIYIDNKILDENYGYEEIETFNRGRANEEITLGEDEYFVMGDNRNNSIDSRTEEVGNIKRDEFVGKAVFRIWPLKEFGKIE